MIQWRELTSPRFRLIFQSGMVERPDSAEGWQERLGEAMEARGLSGDARPIAPPPRQPAASR